MYRVLIKKKSLKTNEYIYAQVDPTIYKTKELAIANARIMFGDDADIKIEEVNKCK